MEIIAKGQLYHRFHGDYSAALGLFFDTAIAADAAFVVLGDPWRREERPGVDKPGLYLVMCRVGREALDKIKDKFKGPGFTLTIDPCRWEHCRNKCADAEIDGLPHSVDLGPRFTLAIECVDPRQTSLL